MDNLQSLVFYLIGFCLSAFFIYKGNRQNSSTFNIVFLGKKIRLNLSIILGLMILITIGAFRYGIGTDYTAYLEIYQHHATGQVINNNTNYANTIEPLFKYLAKLSYWLTKTPLVFFGIPWALTVILTYLGVRGISPNISAKKIALTWFTMASIIFPFGFNQVRQALSVAIFFFSVKYILTNNKNSGFKYLLATFIAFLCHYSSILIMIPAFIISKLVFKSGVDTKKVNLRILIFGALLTILIVLISTIYKQEILLNYSQYKYIREFYRLLFVINGPTIVDIRADNLIVFCILIFPIFAIKSTNRPLSKNENLLSTLCYTGLTLTFLSIFIMNGERFAQYFILFAPLLFFSLNTRKQISTKLYPFLIFSIIMLFGWQGVTNYNTIFNNNVNINAIRQRRVRNLYSQSLCLLKGCNSLKYYDQSIKNKEIYIYGYDELWRLGK